MSTEERRTVHASSNSVEIVRYDKQGKWYIESKNAPTKQVPIEKAVQRAVYLALHERGRINYNQPGGATFDRKVRHALDEA